MSELFREDIIDKSLAIPMYYQLYSYIKDLITNGELKNGDKLPTEEEMMSVLGISRPTIRQAYQELSNRGFVSRQRSKGTIVTKPNVYDKFMNTLESFSNELQMRGDVVTTKVLAFREIEDHGVASEQLNTTHMIYLNRVRYSGTVPISYIKTYVSFERYHDLLKYDMEKKSLYATMRALGYPIVSVKRVIGTTKPDKEVMKWLEMSAKDAVLISRTNGYCEDGTCVEYTIDQYNGAISNFQVELRLNE